MVEGDFSESTSLLSKAQSTAESKNLRLLAEKVASEQQLLEEQFEKWQDLIEKNASYQQRLEHTHYMAYLEEASRVIGQLKS